MILFVKFDTFKYVQLGKWEVIKILVAIQCLYEGSMNCQELRQ